ncbi:hypothetical protein BV25DRAFT_339033 [Artomyces pyxidatus]|uniref:Uncharacterized protein n=1 Tax=Artomyces pyxidatus TaxID=48021 RepID=A0ACB8T5F8_9AGAM|nr:hypothetical protein BV25DRAFT_339033 [Artomyces pyxidatus]
MGDRPLSSILPAPNLPELPELPAQVLQDIFRHLCHHPMAIGPHHSFNPRWISVTHVCRRWRKAALDNPCLWVHLPIQSEPLTQMMLERSRSEAVFVEFHTEDRGVDDNLVLRLAALVTRARSFCVTASISFLSALIGQPRFSCSAPHLRTLELLPLEDMPSGTSPSQLLSRLDSGDGEEDTLTSDMRNLNLVKHPPMVAMLNFFKTNRGGIECLKLGFLDSSPFLALPSSPIRHMFLPYLKQMHLDSSYRVCHNILSQVIVPPSTELKLRLRGVQDLVLFSEIVALRFGRAKTFTNLPLESITCSLTPTGETIWSFIGYPPMAIMPASGGVQMVASVYSKTAGETWHLALSELSRSVGLENVNSMNIYMHAAWTKDQHTLLTSVLQTIPKLRRLAIDTDSLPGLDVDMAALALHIPQLHILEFVGIVDESQVEAKKHELELQYTAMARARTKAGMSTFSCRWRPRGGWEVIVLTENLDTDAPPLQLPNQSSQLTSLPDSVASHYAQQRCKFLLELHKFWAAGKTPLPTALTGFRYPEGYPHQPSWPHVKPIAIGVVRLGDTLNIDLFQLFTVVRAHGGGLKVSKIHGHDHAVQCSCSRH